MRDIWNDYDAWIEACEAAGEPLCFETLQPITERDIDVWSETRVTYPNAAAMRKHIETRAVPYLCDAVKMREAFPTIRVLADAIVRLGDDIDAFVSYDDFEQIGGRTYRCRHCGSRRPTPYFTQRTGPVPRYCTDLCRRLAAADRQRQRRAAQRYGVTRANKVNKPKPMKCAACGKSFTPTRSDAKTCSPRCRKALSRAH